MATPRQKVQVGIFLSVCGLLLVGTLVILAGLHRETAMPYVIEFDESVSGLNVGSDVRYQGVLVGRVAKMEVTPTNRIRVAIEVRPSALRVRPGTMAQLGTTGITGQLYINLTGGQSHAAPLAAGEQIPARPSLLANITTALPEMLASTNAILLRIEAALGQEGQVPAILTATEKLIERLDSAVGNFTSRTLTLLERLDVLAGDQLQPLLSEFTTAAQTLRLAVARTEPVLRETLVTSTQTLQRLERHVAALEPKGTAASLRRSLDRMTIVVDKLGKSSEELTLTLQSVRVDTANVEFQFRQAVRSWRETLLSVKEFVEILEQNPAALLTGRRTPGRSRDEGQR